MTHVVLAMVICTLIMGGITVIEIWGVEITMFAEILGTYFIIMFMLAAVAIYLNYKNEQKRNVSENGKSLID